MLRPILRFALIAAAGMGVSAAPAAPVSLAAMRWQHRVLLLFAPDARSPALRQQRAILTRSAGQAAERDLVAVTVTDRTVIGTTDDAAALRRRFRPARRSFTAILIGKDGGEKLRSTKPLGWSRLEETIDAMPMRRGGGR